MNLSTFFWFGQFKLTSRGIANTRIEYHRWIDALHDVQSFAVCMQTVCHTVCTCNAIWWSEPCVDGISSLTYLKSIYRTACTAVHTSAPNYCRFSHSIPYSDSILLTHYRSLLMHGHTLVADAWPIEQPYKIHANNFHNYFSVDSCDVREVNAGFRTCFGRILNKKIRPRQTQLAIILFAGWHSESSIFGFM